MRVIGFFLSFRGRIGRARFWLLQLLQLVIFFALAMALGAVGDLIGEKNLDQSVALQVVAYGVVALDFALGLSLYVRRFHDLGKSAWWLLVLLIPIVGLIYGVIDCGFVRGDYGPNRYGPDPVGPRSIEEWDAEIRRHPKDAVALNGRGDAHFEKGEYDRAIQDYDLAIRLDPKADLAISNRGLAHLKLGRIEEAIADFDSALRLDPKNEEALYGRGVARLQRGDSTGGDADIKAAKAIKRDVAEQFTRYGVQPG
jgi:uncharacterized membrane protein YhaH (DUF805 family)